MLPLFETSARRLAYGAAALALGACGFPEYEFPASSGAPDASTAGGAGGASTTSSSSSAGGTGGIGGAGGSGGAGGTTTSTTIPPECVIHDDCIQISKPKCDSETGKCVPCLLGDDDICPDDKYCSKTATSYLCKTGCKSDAVCNSTPEADVFTCDPATHKCKGCSENAHCPLGKICDPTSTECVSGCAADHGCDPLSNAKDCCESTCVNLLGDMNNCGSCGNVCVLELPNATGMCSLGTCKLSCDIIGQVDCNKVVDDGCEVDVNDDPNNCAGCGNKCPPAKPTCVNKVCQ